MRGLKPLSRQIQRCHQVVRTFTGAWIETLAGLFSAPLVAFAPSRVRGLKLVISFDFLVHSEFAPSRVRGLKLCACKCFGRLSLFAPSRVRGLKHGNCLEVMKYTPFAPSRVRGLKQLASLEVIKTADVRTFTGAWIETNNSNPQQAKQSSHLHGCVD